MLTGAGVEPARIARVKALILATKTHETHGDLDAALVLDCDLAILGASSARYAENETQIRAEYGWVPEFIYAKKGERCWKGS